MKSLTSNRTRYAVLTTALWTGLFVWIGWLAMSEVAYKRDYVSRIVSRRNIPEYKLGTAINWDEKSRALFEGWSAPEPVQRWSEGKHCVIGIRLGEIPDRESVYQFRMRFVATAGTQKVTATVNGVSLGTTSAAGAGEIVMAMPGSLLAKGPNQFAFDLPNAISPGTRDPRLLGIALRDFTVEAVPKL